MRSSVYFLTAAFAAMAVVPAEAATSTANMNVSIQIIAGCNITLTNINFGSVAANTLSAATTSTAAMGGAFNYACSNTGVTPVLSYNGGNNFSTTNRMKGALGGFIPYTLNMPTLPALSGATQNAQITATIPAQGTLPAVDSYTDTVTLTLTY
jgi:spore coat protein U-like protein